MAKGVSKDKAEEIFELILKFGGYGFNKSTRTRYAIIAFQTAYMKTYHPVEYMAALLTFEMGIDRQGRRIHRRMPPDDAAGGSAGIKVLPPDVNVSDKDFTPIYAERARSENARPRRRDSLRHDGGARRRRKSGRSDHRRAQSPRRFHQPLRFLRARRSAPGHAQHRSRRSIKCGAFSSTEGQTLAASGRSSTAPSKWASRRSRTSAWAR